MSRADPDPHTSADRPVDVRALAQQIARIEAAAEPPWLHLEAARRMAERLGWIKRQPARVLDWWAATSASADVLAAAYPQARILPVARRGGRLPKVATAQAALPWWSPRRWQARDPGPVWVGEDEVPAGAAELVWANMGLHFVPDPQAQMRAWRHALASDGFLMFTTLGPGSFAGLREIYAAAGWGPPHAPLVDMHDLGDMLVEADFAEPVMDQELLRLTYTDPAALLRDLRAWGGNADPQRGAGLRTPRWRRQLEAALAARTGGDGRMVLELELVYGHAFTVPPRPRVAAETQIGLEAMREMMRASRGPRREPRR
jgi:malonyl-CoA O-methyltransferase